MSFDFQTIMVVAVFVMGVIWGIDSAKFAPTRRAKIKEAEQKAGKSLSEEEIQKIAREPVLAEYSRALMPIILIVLILRSFIIEPFRIPSGSMMPTLLVGDFILVNKFSYGVRLPVTNTKILDTGAPQRGDVAVFRYPEDPSTDYIKRIVGLPGDHLKYINKTLYINGEPAKQEVIGSYQGVGSGVSMSGASERIEDITGVQHKILVIPNGVSVPGEVIVPQGQYFVMGDNRDNSRDSRFWGFLEEKYLKGRAFMIWMNWDSANGGVAWSRIGTNIK
ncbi:MAG: signal peptidase I [Gammaproteobacteria bacterium]|nr:signal peptidase I [Gammaproteobacteria bacterium]MDH5593937.1 signal peptidase I [Gammaproteobacteria bacterium]